MKKYMKKNILTVLLTLMITIVFSGCGALPESSQLTAIHAQLDGAITHAVTIGVPHIVINQLRQGEQTISKNRGWFGISDSLAMQQYINLTDRVTIAENTATTYAANQAHTDISQLTNTIQNNIADGIVSPMYDHWTNTDTTQYQNASTPNAFYQVSTNAQQQLAIATSMSTTYMALHAFGSAIQNMESAGISTALPQTEYAQNQRAYAAATTQQDFAQLQSMISAETIGLINFQIQSIPFVGDALIGTYAQSIKLLQSYGEDTSPYSAAIQADRQQLATIATLPAYLDFQHTVQQQMADLTFSMSRGQTRHDIQQFQALLTFSDTHGIMDYEYSGVYGLQDLQNEFDSASSLSDYQAVDTHVTALSTNLRAMIANISDPAQYNQPHQQDLNLMQFYTALSGKVIIVSLREQALRAYDHGQLIMSMPITTGRPELPTPPGFWDVQDRQQNIIFHSGDAPGSQFWYPDTFINYALLYKDGGFYLHDAWWRTQFGPGSNVPHNDPRADNDGSHGCVNIPLQQMGLLYEWTSIGTPVIVY